MKRLFIAVIAIPLLTNVAFASSEVDESTLPTPVKLHTSLQDVLSDPPCTLEGKLKPGKTLQVLSCSDYSFRGKNTETDLWFYSGSLEKIIYSFDNSRTADVRKFITGSLGNPDTSNYYDSLKNDMNDTTYANETVVLRETEGRNFTELMIISNSARKIKESYSG